MHGNLYGTSRGAIEERIAGGQDVLLEIDWQGALQIKRLFPNAVLIFILPPSWDELLQRLAAARRGRPEVIAQRMENARDRGVAGPALRLRYNQRPVRDGAVRPEGDRPLAAAQVRGAAAGQARGLRGTRSALTSHACACPPRSPPVASMARITVEDCLVKIPNRFQLVLAATYRARMLSQGHAPKVETKNKPGVTALREIAAGEVGIEMLRKVPV